MNSGNNFFSFIPQLKPYQIIPSEDDPKEFILLLEENGAALGINHTERRLIEYCDGRSAIGDMILRVTNESSARITDIRRLIWDLDRFGFFESSPWEELNVPYAWGYWGIKKPILKTVYYSSVLGGLERQIASWALHPIVLLISFLIACGLFWWSIPVWTETPLFIVNQSFAFGMLVLIVGILACVFISSWAAAAGLRSVHDSPVGMVFFWQSPFPRVMLDGRRVRSLSLTKSMCAGLIPAVKLVWIATLFSLAASLSEGVRREWLVHISLAALMTAFGVILPWFSTVLSRDIVLRLRGDSVFWTTLRSVKLACQSLFQSSQKKQLHERLFLWWGVWAILSSLILIRLMASLFRADYPVLLGHFLQEDSALVLWIFIVVSSIIIIGVIGALLTFITWIIREGIKEIRLRAFPQHDQKIAASVILSILFVAVVCIASGSHTSSEFLHVSSLIIGAGISLFALRMLVFENKGFPFYLHLHGILTGIMICWLGYGSNLFSISVPFKLDWIAILLSLVGVFVVSLARQYPLWGREAKISKNNKLLFCSSFFVFLIIIHLMINFGNLNTGMSLVDVRSLLVALEILTLVALMKMCQTAFSPLPLIFLYGVGIGAIAPFLMEGLRSPMDPTLHVITLAFLVGATIAVYILYFGISSRVALQVHQPVKTRKNNSPAIATIDHAILSGLELLLPAQGKPALHQIPGEDEIRSALRLIANRVGLRLMQALFYRAAHELPWHAAQKLAALMPPAVPLPKVGKWNDEQIISYLRNVPTFMNAGDEIERIAQIARFRFFQTEDRLITQDTVEDDLLIIVQGKAAVDIEHPFGHSRIAVMAAGDFVGEIGFLSGAPRTATVRALEPVTVLAVSRNDIGESMPKTLAGIRNAEAGQSWLQALAQYNIFREFSPTLLARVCLESQHVHLEVSRTLLMHQDAFQNNVAVLLSGEAVLQQDEENTKLNPGSIAGLVETILDEPLRGIIRADTPAHLLLVERGLFRSALIELLTPKQILTLQDTTAS